MSKIGLFGKLLAKNLRAMGGPHSYEAGGMLITCPHCKNDKFHHSYRLLNTVGLSFMNLDFANRQAHTLMCDRCGRIQWFGKSVTRLIE